MRVSLIAVILFIFSFTAKAQFYNGLHTDFGKNRIQHETYMWQFFRFEKFDTYFYPGGREVAIYTAYSASKNLRELEEMIDYSLDENIQFIIYNKQSDFRQSNLGLVTDESDNIGGVTRIAGNKVIIYYEGDHQKLEQQVRAGIAEVLLNQLMYGGNWKERVKNSTLLNIPEWYSKGFISYASTEWNTEIENRVRDGIESERYRRFNRLEGIDAVYAGHSVWKYVADNYGVQVIPNILYMTRISRNIESGFMFVLGMSLKKMSKEWYVYYKKNLETDSLAKLPAQPPVIKKSKSSRVYTQYKISPDGKYAAYSTNELGQYKLFVKDLEKNKTKRIWKSGNKLNRINDYSYPLITWHPTSELFSFITEKKGNVVLSTYTLETKKIDSRPPLYNFEKVLDFGYSHDGKKYVMSAVQNGQTDIFVFNIASSTVEQITKDHYDDLYPRFTNRSSQIIFSSNRDNDTIRFATAAKIEQLPSAYDIFQYNYTSKYPVLRRITNTPDASEMQPAEFDSTHVTYLSDANGIYNRYIARFDSVISFVDTAAHYRYFSIEKPVTNYKRSIIEQDINSNANRYSEIIYTNGKYRVYSGELSKYSNTADINLKKTKLKQNSSTAKAQDKKQTPATSSKPADSPVITVKVFDEDQNPSTKKLDIDNYKFDSEESLPAKKADTIPQVKINADTATVTNELSDEFEVPKQRNYMRTFLPDQIVTQLDNSFLNANYQKFSGGGALFFNPGFSGLFKLGASDVFEDYRIVGGLRLGGNFDSNEYLLSYEDRSKRLDKQLIFHRQAYKNQGIINSPKVITHTLRYVNKYPFNEVSSIRASLSGRNDRIIFMATDYQNLKKEDNHEYWGIGKVEYVFDNTISKGINLYNGTRFKVFGEYFNQLNKNKTNITILGIDFRHYQKIHRDLIWANRFAASTSFGPQKLIYYMGGVDNWLNFGKHPTFDYNNPIDYTQNYTFQTLATNMRGFSQNARNGNSFAVINSELRWPIFRYLFNRPLRSDFLTNFQIIGFGDVGTAWTGKNPYSNDNAFNSQTIGNPPITVTLKSQREPIIGGYGFGLRSRIWGYFIRADWAYGIEDRQKKPSIFYLSLSLDF